MNAGLLEVQRCSSCRARIVWTTSARNRRPMPLDAVPAEPGTRGAMVVVNGWAYGERDLAERMAESRAITVESARQAIRDEGWPWHLSHHATCPDADQYRPRKKKRRGTR